MSFFLSKTAIQIVLLSAIALKMSPTRYFSKLDLRPKQVGSLFIAVLVMVWLMWSLMWPIPKYAPEEKDDPIVYQSSPEPIMISTLSSLGIEVKSSLPPAEPEQFNVDKKGFWVGLGSTRGHKFDSKLATALVSFFNIENASSVLELGAGLGQYSRALQASGIFTSCYDGNPNSQELTSGHCGVLDLSKPIAITKHAWVLSLEVGEHIPRQFEKVFIDNLDRGNEKGIVLSWAVEGQVGTGHVNNRNNTYIRDLMTIKGYSSDMEAEKLLRNQTSEKYKWFKGTLMVFRKSITLN